MSRRSSPMMKLSGANLADSRETPVEVSLAMLDALHQRWVILLRSMRPEDFSRRSPLGFFSPLGFCWPSALGWPPFSSRPCPSSPLPAWAPVAAAFRRNVQAGVAGGVGQGSHAAVVLVLAAVKGHLGHSGGQGPLGDQLAHRGGGRLVAAVGDLAGQLLVHGAGGGQGPARLVVDHLRGTCACWSGRRRGGAGWQSASGGCGRETPAASAAR